MSENESNQSSCEEVKNDSEASPQQTEETNKSQTPIRISFEEAQRIIDKQFETHHKNQNNAIKLIRSMVASFAVLITLVSAILSGRVTQFINIPSFTENLNRVWQSRFTQYPGIFGFKLGPLPEEVTIIYVVFGMLTLLAIGFVMLALGIRDVSFAIIGLFTTLSAPNLNPISDESDVEKVLNKESVKNDLGKTYKKWIESNRKPIAFSNQRLNATYRRLFSGSIYLAIGVLYFLLTYFAAVDTGVVVTLVVISLYEIKKFVKPELNEYEDFWSKALFEPNSISFNRREKLILYFIATVTGLVFFVTHYIPSPN